MGGEQGRRKAPPCSRAPPFPLPSQTSAFRGAQEQCLQTARADRQQAGNGEDPPAAWLPAAAASRSPLAAAIAAPAVARSALQSEMAKPWFMGFCSGGTHKRDDSMSATADWRQVRSALQSEMAKPRFMGFCSG